MGRLVFVHGINVRAPEGPGEHPYDETCRAIGYELFLKNIKWRIAKCSWGDDLGARLLAKGVSFPPERDKKLAEVIGPDDPAKLWGILFEDPTFEVRALSSMPETEAEAMVPGAGRPKWVELEERLQGDIEPNEKLKERLARLQLEKAFPIAVRQTKDDPFTLTAVRHPEAFRAVARAVVARTVSIGLDQGIPAPGFDDLEAMTLEMEQILRDGELFGISDWAKSTLLGWGTTMAVRRRASLAQTATPIAGDIILYQASGKLLRDRIAEVVEEEAKSGEPVAILAHSLGGVAAVETLCERQTTRQQVKKLITAGSQSGYFYEINALRTLPFGEPLPDNFPDWLNFWDYRDFLSFVVEPVFTGGGRRQDVSIESGLPFVASHSGYWRQSKTWDAIKTFLGE
ncbi:hypothetical protein IVB30_20155 [Bradyrhizobium sp. 200]|uniref:hypothetical protein n=1 Tax=Bradyrhizobium sp. 200 TaxID=2782665 RepID=UPI001FFE5276|nr:hypothetical protein [Bradyrhizobium sp. 200]UPJ53421.1 hypothetical protein IVB30_20155 [Bradyrhizobium sp. 200]